jgi:hypothetical protein
VLCPGLEALLQILVFRRSSVFCRFCFFASAAFFGSSQFFFALLDFFHPLGQEFLPAFLCRIVVFAAAKIIWHALHVGDFFVEVMRVLVAFAVTDLLHQLCYRIADVQRNGLGCGPFDVFLNRAVGGV